MTLLMTATGAVVNLDTCPKILPVKDGNTWTVRCEWSPSAWLTAFEVPGGLGAVSQRLARAASLAIGIMVASDEPEYDIIWPYQTLDMARTLYRKLEGDAAHEDEFCAELYRIIYGKKNEPATNSERLA